MGDISAEPSMEEILSSIKRIIAEEGDVAQSRPRRPQRPAAAPAATSSASEPQPQFEPEPVEEVLELSDPIQPPAPPPPEIEPPVRRAAESSPPPAAAEPASIVSRETAAASRGSLDALTKMRVKPEAGDMTLEALARELLRPMLSEWLDAHLPALVETMVAREIERITNQQP